jgi:hypothetical protein
LVKGGEDVGLCRSEALIELGEELDAVLGGDDTSDVVLVEPKDAFMHNIAALRALVDPSWLPKIFLPYAGLLTNGRVVRDRAVVVDPHRVVTASGEEITADYSRKRFSPMPSGSIRSTSPSTTART